MLLESQWKTWNLQETDQFPVLYVNLACSLHASLPIHNDLFHGAIHNLHVMGNQLAISASVESLAPSFCKSGSIFLWVPNSSRINCVALIEHRDPHLTYRSKNRTRCYVLSHTRLCSWMDWFLVSCVCFCPGVSRGLEMGGWIW